MEDIKDAGVLAGFIRWGWPWHGLIQSGTIGSTGQAHAQPSSGDAWLIDKGLDPLDLTPEQIAAYAADGMEWRNYALIPRGYVYNTDIGVDSFIHVDEAGDCWRVAVDFSFPSTNTLRVTSTISRFGLLIVTGATITPSTIEKTVDVSCANIELANGLTIESGASYVSRDGELHDVATNGATALIGVMLVDTFNHKDLLSVVEITISGTGGEDGSGLVLDGDEVIGQTGLTLGTTTIDGWVSTGYSYYGTFTYVDDDAPCDVEPYVPGRVFDRNWTFTPDAGTPPLATATELDLNSTGTGTVRVYARQCYYKEGVPTALRILITSSWLERDVSDGSWATENDSQVCQCDLPSSCTPSPARAYKVYQYEDREFSGYRLLENSTVVDSLGWIKTSNVENQIQYLSGNPRTEGSTGSSTVSYASVGSLASFFPAGVEWQGTSAGGPTIHRAFRLNTDNGFTEDLGISVASVPTGLVCGIHRMPTKACGFFASVDSGATALEYGTLITNIGNFTTAVPPSENVRFACNRKTEDYTFANAAGGICYI